MQKNTRNTKQREIIHQYLLSTKKHPTAEKVYENIHDQLPSVSLATVYRNLNFLAESGQALKLDCGDGIIHFDGNPIPHNHFCCRKCGQVLDLEMDSIDHIEKIAAAGFGGKIEGHHTYFYGLCENCI